jgi:hypothetical protein
MDGGSRNEARIRGNAHQLHEKYKNLARDAASAGDRILAEYYLQHADHYYRVLAEFRPRDEQRPRHQNDDFDGDDDGAEPIDMTPQGFGATAAVQAFGVEAAQAAEKQSAPASSDSDDDDGDEGDGDEAPAQAAAQESDDEDRDDAPRRRGRRGRGRGRPRAGAGEPAVAEGRDTDG